MDTAPAAPSGTEPVTTGPVTTEAAEHRPSPGRAAPRWVVLAVAAGIAPLAAQIPPLTWQATAATLVVGTGVLVLVARGWPARISRPLRAGLRGAVPWFALAATFVALELATLLAGSRPEFPTVSSLLGPLFVDTGPRVVGWFAWLTAGYWLLQR